MGKYIIILLAFPLFIFSEFFNFEFGESQYASLSTQTTVASKILKKKECSECHTSIYNKFMHEAAEDCSTCHEAVEKKHPKKGVKSFKLVDKVPDLCFTCHEENAVKKHLHAPSSEGECLMCHNPHSSRKPGLLIKNNTSKLCAECHEMDMHQKKYRHRPIQKGSCQSCHDPHQSNNRTLLKELAPQLCFTCHKDKKEAMDMENIHAPFDDDCSSCHETHSSDNKHLTTMPMPNLCYECHDDVETAISEKKFVHKAVNEKSACAGCHDPHASNYGQFLKAEGNNLCLSCHNKDMKGEGYTIRNIRKLTRKEYIHPPVDDGCATCHEAHASNNDMLLTDPFPRGTYTIVKKETFALCFNCHDESLLLDAETRVATEFRNGSQNLHSLHINGDKGRNCTNCHNVHGADNEHLIEDKVPFGSWEMPINYLTTDNGGSCATACHAFKEYDRTSDFKPVNKLVVLSTKKEKEVVAEVKEEEVKAEKQEEIVEEEKLAVLPKDTDKTISTESEIIAETTEGLGEIKVDTIAIEKIEAIEKQEEIVEEEKLADLLKDTVKAISTESEIIAETAEGLGETKVDTIAIEKIEAIEKQVEIVEEEKLAVLLKDTVKAINTESEIIAETAEGLTKEKVEEEVHVEIAKTVVAETTKVVTAIKEYNNLKKLELIFEFDKATLNVKLENDLKEIIQFMKKYPELNFEIQGHTDSIGNALYNLYLSEKRAKSVQDILVENGIDKMRITIKGYGEAMPKNSNKTIQSRSKNRRVEIKPQNMK